MTAYYLAQLHVHDPSWAADYREAVTKIVEKNGGKYLAAAREPEHLEGTGETPSVTVIIEFPDLASAKAFYESEEYKPHHAARLAGSSGDLWLFEGM